MFIGFKSILYMMPETQKSWFPYKSTIQTSFWNEMCQKKSNIDTAIDFVKKKYSRNNILLKTIPKNNLE